MGSRDAPTRRPLPCLGGLPPAGHDHDPDDPLVPDRQAHRELALVRDLARLAPAGELTCPGDDVTAGFLELCKALNAKGTPAGFPHGKAVGDGNNYAHWLLWSQGGKMINEDGTVGLDTAETRAAIEYAKELYATFIPGTESWLDINNNRAFLANQISLTANGVSLYYAAMNDPALQEIGEDIRTTNMPIGPVGQSVELHQTTTAVIFNYTPYPNAAKAYLKFMFEREQMADWIEKSLGYCCQSLKAYADNPVWSSDPNAAAYSRASETLRPNGYAGPLGYASAAVMADYIIVDMVAEAATGQRTPEEAAKRAEQRANRYYRV